MQAALDLITKLQADNDTRAAALHEVLNEVTAFHNNQVHELKSLEEMRAEWTAKRRAWAAQNQISEQASFDDIFTRMEKEFVASEGFSPLEVPSDILSGLEKFASPENLEEFRDAYYSGQRKLYADLFAKFLAPKTSEITKALNAGEEWF